MWGARLAVPLGGATVDDVHALVDAVHRRMDVIFPTDEYFLNVLGTGRLVGRIPKRLDHLRGRVLLLGSYKARQPHVDALKDVERSGESDALRTQAKAASEIDQRAIRDCVDALAPEVRGGTWYWRGGDADDYEALMQEHRAWTHLGATLRDLSHDFAEARRSLGLLEQEYGGADPTKCRRRVCHRRG